MFSQKRGKIKNFNIHVIKSGVQNHKTEIMFKWLPQDYIYIYIKSKITTYKQIPK